MGSVQVNTFNVTVGSGSASVLQKPIKFNKGRKCMRMRLRAAATFSSTDASPYNFTAADAALFAGAIFANLDVQFGETDPEQIDANMPFLMSRVMYAVMEGKDFTINNFPMNALTGSNVQIAALAANQLVTFEFIRSFSPSRLNQELHDFCPGYSQMSSMRLAVTPSAGALPTTDAAKVTLSNASAVPITVIFEDMPAEEGADIWASVVKGRQTTTPGIDIPLPIASGAAIIGIADFSAAAASYTLGLFQIFADGIPIHGITTFAQYLTSYQQDLVLGLNGFDPNSLVSVLYSLPVYDDVVHLDTAEALVFEQPNNNIAAPVLTVFYIERISKQRRDQIGGNILTKTGRSFKLVSKAAALGQSMPEPVASVLPMRIVAPTEAAYQLVPGTKYASGAPPTDDIPKGLLDAANLSAHQAQGGATSPAGAAATARAAKAITAALPGYASPNKNLSAPTNAHLAVVNSIVTHGQPDAVTAQARGASAVNWLLSKF